MQQISQQLAATLKQQRKQRGWSLDKAAASTGVSKAMLGQIERGESSPTLATLWKIADGFQLSLSALINLNADDDAGQDASGNRSGESKHLPTQIADASKLRHQPTQDAMLVAPLFAFDPTLGFEVFEMTLPPGYERCSEAHARGVTELVLVTQGKLELFLEGHWQPLTQGQSARFAADQAHGYRNTGDQIARFHNIIHYPDSAALSFCRARDNLSF